MTTINDLPNELLDEIFAYVNPVIGSRPIIPINTVCRKWNRPFMTQSLNNMKVAKDIDLQSKFPRLVSLKLYRNHAFDFKGHAYLKELILFRPIDLSSLNCPRLTQLNLHCMHLKDLFNPKTLKACLKLCSSLTHLTLGFELDQENHDYNQVMSDIIQSRPRDYPGLGLKHLIIYEMPDVWFDLTMFFRVFESPSLATMQLACQFKSGEQVSKFVSSFRNVSDMTLRDLSIVNFNQGCVFEHVKNIDLIEPLSIKVMFSSLLIQFPNLESMDVEWIANWDVPVPNRITELHSMDNFELSMAQYFPFLKELKWRVDLESVNDIMAALHRHCPRLVKIELRNDDPYMFSPIDLQLDQITFPCLKRFSL